MSVAMRPERESFFFFFSRSGACRRRRPKAATDPERSASETVSPDDGGPTPIYGGPTPAFAVGVLRDRRGPWRTAFQSLPSRGAQHFSHCRRKVHSISVIAVLRKKLKARSGRAPPLASSIGHNYIGHNHIGHEYMRHEYFRHNHIGHNYNDIRPTT